MIVPKIYTEVIYYVLIPVFIVILVFGLAMIYVAIKDKKEVDLNRRFKMNYWSSIAGIIFGAILLTVSLGFSIAFLEKIYTNQLQDAYPLLVGLLYVFPIVPLGFLIFCVVKFVKVLNHRNEIIVEVE